MKGRRRQNDEWKEEGGKRISERKREAKGLVKGRGRQNDGWKEEGGKRMSERKRRQIGERGQNADSLIGFYGISTIVGYLMPNPVHIYIYIYIYITNILICKHILLITFLNEPGLIFFAQLSGFNMKRIFVQSRRAKK